MHTVFTLSQITPTITAAIITAIATVLAAVITAVGVLRKERKPREISQQVRNYEEEVKKVDEFVSEANSPDRIIEIVEYSLGRPRDVWGKLLMIRMTLRRLLRNTAEARGIQFRPTAGIITMRTHLKQSGIIDETLDREVERIRAATFTAEWGAGYEAHPEDVQFALKNYGGVFAKLKEKMSSTGPI